MATNSRKLHTEKLARLARSPAPQAAPNKESQPHLIGYARVSMADQNPRMQIEALMAHGVAEEDIYYETASGASTANRPKFQAMMKDAREGDVIVVWKLDRLGRNTAQVLTTFQELDRKGAKVRVLTQPGMDTTTPTGRLIVTVMAAVAELERDFIVERTAAGLASARASGRIGGRRSKVTDEQILSAWQEHGTAAGARRVKLSKVQFLRRLNKIRGLT